jgi:hypothetical protein
MTIVREDPEERSRRGLRLTLSQQPYRRMRSEALRRAEGLTEAVPALGVNDVFRTT